MTHNRRRYRYSSTDLNNLIKNDLKLRDNCNTQIFSFNPESFIIKCKTESQRKAKQLFGHSNILTLIGPAGCGKTWLSTALAINELYHGRVKKLIFTRPLVDAGEKLGFLPGEIANKTDPYMRPIFDQFDELIGNNHDFREHFNKYIEVVPLAFTRGRTFKNSICVLDEAQNANYKQLKMFLTRFDENSKIVLNGDLSQIDIYDSGLECAISDLNGMDGFNVVYFDINDNVRHPIVSEIHNRMNKQ